MGYKEERDILLNLPTPDVVEEAELSMSDKFKAGFRAYTPGFTQLETKTAMNTGIGYDPTFSVMSDEASELFEQYGIVDKSQYRSAYNIESLRQQLEANKSFEESRNIIDNMGLAEGIFYASPAFIANPINYIPIVGQAKHIGTVANALNSFKTAAIGTAQITAIEGINEYALQSLNEAPDMDRLQDTMLYSAMFSLPVLYGVNVLSSTGLSKPAATALYADNLQGAGLPEGRVPNVVSSWSNVLYTSTNNQLILSENPIARQLALNSDVVSPKLVNADGTPYVQSEAKAYSIKYQVGHGNYNKFNLELQRAAKEANMDVGDFSRKLGDEVFNYNTKAETEALERVLKLSDDEKYALYMSETGVKSFNISELPEDFFSVLKSAKLKELATDPNYKPSKYVEIHQKFAKAFADRGTTAGIRGLAGKDGSFYMHLQFDSDKAAELGQPALAKRIEDAMLASKENQWLMQRDASVVESIKKYALGLAEKIIQNDLHALYDSGGLGRAVESTSALKHRGLKVERSLLSDLYIKDIDYLNQRYADIMSGRIALKEAYGIEAGTGSVKQAIDAKINELIQTGNEVGMKASQIKRDVANARAILEDVLGTRKFVQNPDYLGNKLARMLRKSASALYSGGFVQWAVGEVGAAVTSNGAGNVLKTFIPAHKRMLDLLNTAKPTDPIVKEVLSLGLAEQIVTSNRLTRYDLQEMLHTKASMTEEWLDKASNWARKYSGFNFVTATSELLATMSGMEELISKVGKPLSKGDIEKFARYGLSEQDIARIKPDTFTYTKGIITDWNLDKLPPDLSAKIRNYLLNMSRDTIIRADASRIHRALSDVNDPIKALMFQYLQFPAASFERLTMQGIQADKARYMVGVMTSATILYSILELQNQARHKLGITEEADTPEDIALKTFTRIGAMGLVPNVINAGMVATGTPSLDSDRLPSSMTGLMLGAGGGVADRAYRTHQKMIGNEEWDIEDIHEIGKWTPAYSIPYIKLAFDAVLKENQ